MEVLRDLTIQLVVGTKKKNHKKNFFMFLIQCKVLFENLLLSMNFEQLHL